MVVMIKTIKNYYDAIFNKYDLCDRSVTAWGPPIDCETAEKWTYYEEAGLCFRYSELYPQSKFVRCNDWQDPWKYYENCCPAEEYDVQILVYESKIVWFIREYKSEISLFTTVFILVILYFLVKNIILKKIK